VTALQVAKAACANCDSAGNCAGICIANDLSCYMFRQPGKCWLAEQPIKPCTYFEAFVAPQARAREAKTEAQKRALTKLDEGVREYEVAVTPVPSAKWAKCKTCHRRVNAPKRLCGKCARNSTLKSKRRWWSRTRKNGAVEALISRDL
jgi:hypothetical protein